jgi:S-layer protein (TIGR01567 family)
MPGFTEVENRIIKRYIRDHDLSNSLNSIRRVMESIWASESPKIVKDFTDHGEEHSKRVACYAEKLLNINSDANFYQSEIYLLLAGVYLHDIGMQCDIAKYPKIKEKASELGAEFNEAFTSKTTNGYSQEEQKEVRKNHNYLSAAWIDYVYENKDELLHLSVKSIPDDLVDDLMDVCKFHSSELLISDCDDTFRFNTNNRKRMIAAILRFADELDISSTRVKLETVKIFNLYPDNSVYWWLHKYTKVIFIGSNRISLSVRLHPEDIKLYGSFIRENYIHNFRSKNQSIVDVLVKHKIPVVIDDNSDVVANNRAEQFPPEITAFLEKNIQNGDLGEKCPSRKPQRDIGLDRTLSKGKEKEANLEKNLENLGSTKPPETLISPSKGIEFVLIPAGKFMMGSPRSAGTFQFLKDKFNSNELPIHEVIFEHHFFLGKFPITQEQWIDVMGNNPSKHKGDTRPVDNVSWDDALEFIKKLNKMERNKVYRLPSEVEWEYACRAFTQTTYSFGDDLSNMDDYAWCKNYSGTHSVGQKKTNPLGLYDMHGNVWEWVQDSWHDNYNGAPSDGSSWENGDGSDGVIRGGNFADPGLCRSASRLRAKPSRRSHDVGIRLLRELSVAYESTATSSSNCLIPVIATNCSFNYWGWYLVITLFGEKYVLIKYNDASKLAKLLLDSNVKYTLKTGEKLDLGFGYAIEAKQVDVDGKKVWFEFTKDGQYVDDNIVATDTGDKTWTCVLDNIRGEDSVPVMKIHANHTFHGAVDSIVLIDGLWLIDYSNAMEINVDDKLGHFKLMKINNGVDESNLGSLVFEADGTQNNIQTAASEVTSTSTSTPE